MFMWVLRICCRLLFVKMFVSVLFVVIMFVIFNFFLDIFSSVLVIEVLVWIRGILLLFSMILLILSRSFLFKLLFGCESVKLFEVKFFWLSSVIVSVLFIISVVVVFDVGVRFSEYVFFLMLILSMIFVCCFNELEVLLVMVIICMFKCLIMGNKLISLLVLLELEMVSKILFLFSMFKLLWLVLLGCMKNVGVFVLVSVVVILFLICLDFFILFMIILFL